MRTINHQRFKYRRKELRNESTFPEIVLWNHIKQSKLGYKFRRQHGIGPYIVDFYCSKCKLIIEIDGEYHDLIVEYDYEREMYLKNLGYRIVRFNNDDIKSKIHNVIATIRENAKSPPL